MTKREPVSSQLISYAVGGDMAVLRTIHNGLVEVPLKGLVPYWNLEELLVFSHHQWALREKMSRAYYWPKYKKSKVVREWADKMKAYLTQDDFYQVAHAFFSTGMREIRILKNKGKKDFSLEREYSFWNPYGQKKNLKERLGHIHPLVFTELKNNLAQPVKVYVRTDQKEYALKAQDTDPRPIFVYHFLPARVALREREKHVCAQLFAEKIAEKINSYY